MDFEPVKMEEDELESVSSLTSLSDDGRGSQADATEKEE